MHKLSFKNKENFELVTKYLGKLPCEECLVSTACFNTRVNDDDDGWYDICLNQPCDDAKIWLRKAVPFGRYLIWFTDLDIELPDQEDIMKMYKMFREAMGIPIEI